MNTETFFLNASYIYKHLQDDESKKIYRAIIDFYVTGDRRYLTEMNDTFLNNRASDDFREHVKKGLGINKADFEEGVFIYGGGHFGAFVAKLINLLGIKLLGVYDRCEGIPVCGVETKTIECLMKEYGGQKVIITTTQVQYADAMLDKLRSLGVNEKNIVKVNTDEINFGNPQYFEEDIVSFKREEYFVDCGGYNLGTTVELAKRCKRLKKAWAFEPDPENIRQCENAKTYSGLDNVNIIKCGVWSRSGELKFEQDGSASCISNDGGIVVPVKSIDEVVGAEKVTFIKMDVEGAELEGLKGARATIERNRPLLAICLYHKMQDIVEIPKYILDLQLGYKIYIRKYCWSTLETVLYAVPDNRG